MDQRYTAGVTCREGICSRYDWPPGSVGGSAGLADWPCILGTVDKPPGGVWIDFIGRTVGDNQSIVAVPVTGSLVSPTLFSCRDADFSYRSSRFCVNCDMDFAGWISGVAARTRYGWKHGC